MSARRLPFWPCLQTFLGYVFFILPAVPGTVTALSGQNCSHPVIPEHSGFQCRPSPCGGFPHGSTIHYFCESGYVLPGRAHHSKCQNGRWRPSVPSCVPNPAGNAKPEDGETNSMSSVATTAVGVSIFLLTTTACMVVKSRLYTCRSQSRRPSDQFGLMVDSLPGPLPSYEEAVYGSWGQRLPPLRGPTQLLLASPELSPSSSLVQSDTGHRTDASDQSADAAPPPPYEALQQRPADGGNGGEARASLIALSVEKDG